MDFESIAGFVNVEGRKLSASTENDAGEVLYILCTNFLLYVALVLLTYLVCKLYLTTDHSWEFIEGISDFKLAPTDSMDCFPNIEDPAEDEEASKPLVEEDEEGAGIEMTGAGEEAPLPPPPAESPLIKRSSSGSLGDLLDYNRWGEDADTSSRGEVLQRLLVSVLGLNLSFLAWGVLQERMLTQTYQGEFFTYSYMLVFTNRLGGLVLSAGLLYFFKPPIETRAMIYEYSFPSVSNMLSSWCQYEALKYVTFPTQMLSKCFKLVPIMVMGKVMGNKSYPMYDYVVAAVIGLGISVFLMSTEGLDLGRDATGEAESASGTYTGVLLLGLFLVFDSFTSQWQTRMFDRNKYLSPFQMMFAINFFSTIFSLITLLHTNELTEAWDFVVAHPQIHVHFIVFSICSTIGQLFIFYTIKNFGAVVFAIIMSTRILLSIAVSCYTYDHTITEMGFIGILIVFGAISYRVKRKSEGKRLIKWAGVAEERGTDLFAAWHEHLDM